VFITRIDYGVNRRSCRGGHDYEKAAVARRLRNWFSVGEKKGRVVHDHK